MQKPNQCIAVTALFNEATRLLLAGLSPNQNWAIGRVHCCLMKQWSSVGIIKRYQLLFIFRVCLRYDVVQLLTTFEWSTMKECLQLFQLTIFGAPKYSYLAYLAIFGHIWHIWARKIWSCGVSLKRSCKMQFSNRVGLRSIGPSSQKLQPNFWPISIVITMQN